MKRMLPGLYAGERVRVERGDAGWRTEVKLRDCGAILGIETGYFEGHEDGLWTDIGTYRNRTLAQKACDALYAGTHVFRKPVSTEAGPMPGLIVPSAQAQDEISAATTPTI